jgi:hypothetical protein
MQIFMENTTRRSRERSIQLRECAPKRNVLILNTKAVATLVLKMNRAIIVECEKQAVQLEGRLIHRSLNTSIIRQGGPMGQSTLILIRGAINLNWMISGAPGHCLALKLSRGVAFWPKVNW